MYKFNKKAAVCAILLSMSVFFTSCSSASIGEQIKIPIYEDDSSLKTANAEYKDLTSSKSVGASIGYVFANNLQTQKSANLVSIEVGKYTEVKEGDIIASFDTSEMDYELLEQQIKAQSAYDAWQADGSERLRLEYEQEKAKLAAVQYEINSYNIIAPFDGIITDVASIEVGTEVGSGTYICSIAQKNDIFIHLSDDVSLFKIGTGVKVKLTGSEYDAAVVSVPTSESSDSGEQRWGQNAGGGQKGNSVSCDSEVIIGFTPETLEAMLAETPNAVDAGWATVTVATAEKHNVLAVPEDAVKLYGGVVYVNQLSDDGQRLQTPVETGATINGFTIILSGLSEGDTVILD